MSSWNSRTKNARAAQKGFIMAATVEDVLNITIDTHECQLASAEEEKCREALDGLSRQVEHFPVSDLRVYVERQRSNEVTVKLTLILPGTTLVAEDHDRQFQTAFDRALDSLLLELEGYKDRLGRVEERQKVEKGTHQEVHSAALVDFAELDEAVAAGDYPAFRLALLPVEEEVRMRIGRWTQRYPEFNALIGQGVEIADVLEEVFLLAFEGYQDRPQDVPAGMWLENLIDPAIKSLERNPDEELENVNMARTVRDAPEGKEPV